MANKIRIGFAGGGGVLGWHVSGLLEIPDKCEIVAVAEKNEANYPRIRETVQNPGIKIFGDYEEMFDHGGLDAVFINFPHHMHMEAAVKAAQAGYHVLCEKVMARNTYECQKMIDAANEAGVILGIAHDRRFSGDWETLKRIADAGALGDIEFARFEYNGDVNAKNTGSWLYNIDTMGGGATMGTMTHQIDGLRWLCGEADSLHCTCAFNPDRIEGDTGSVVTARMKSGALALVTINYMTQISNEFNTAKNTLWYEFIHLCGKKGDAYFIHNKGTYLKLRGKSGLPEYEAAEKGDFALISSVKDLSGHKKMVKHFVQLLRGEPNAFTSFGHDAIKTVEIAEAAYISNEKKAEVKLPIERRPWDERIYLRKPS